MVDLVPVEGDPFVPIPSLEGYNLRGITQPPGTNGSAPAPAATPAPQAGQPAPASPGDVTLIPTDGDPFVGQYGGEVGGQVLSNLASGLMQWLETPGAVMHGTQPADASSISEGDVERARQAEGAVNQWAPATALMMVGSGAPAAEEGALGTAGGRVTLRDGTEIEIPEPPQTTPPAPPFYSSVERAVANAGTNAAPAQQWLGAIRNTAGVKPEELQWTGLEDWLNGQTGSVPKQAVQDYLAGNKVDVREVMHSAEPDLGPQFQAIDQRIREIQAEHEQLDRAPDSAAVAGQRLALYNERTALAEQQAQLFVEKRKSSVKFSHYTLPGGEDYRELLLTMPSADHKYIAITDAMRAKYGDKPLGQMPMTDAERATIDRQIDRYGDGNEDVFKSGHWDEPNVLAHVRFDDRMIGNDNTLHMAEVQSDWHQKGRKQGYQGTPLTYALRERPSGGWGVYNSAGVEVGGAPSRANAEAVLRDYQSGAKSSHEPRVPDTPFKTTWPELSLKRMIRYAAENGYDRLSWDTGATNAERYDLSKQVDYLLYKQNPDGTFRVSAQLPGGRGHLLGDAIPGQELENHVGKDVAQRIADGAGRELNTGGPGSVSQPRDMWKKLSGLDLKVGGEGMKGFYDRMLPAAANKLGKKYGATVEQSEVGTLDESQFRKTLREHDYDPERVELQQILTDNGGRLPDWMDQEDAEAMENGIHYQGVSAKRSPVWSLKITPALRKAALEQGFPLFAATGIAAGAVARHLTPVDHDPFARSLVPVDHNPFQ